MGFQEIITGDQPFSHLAMDMAVCMAIARKEIPQRPFPYIPEASEDGDKLWELLRSCWVDRTELRPTAATVQLEVRVSITSCILLYWTESYYFQLSHMTQASLKPRLNGDNRGAERTNKAIPQAPGKPSPEEQIRIY